MAEHITMEAEPAEPVSKSLPASCSFPALSRHRDQVGVESEEDDDNDCEIVEPLCGGAEKGREERRRADLRECSVSIGSTPLGEPFPPSVSPAGPVPDPPSPTTASGAAAAAAAAAGMTRAGELPAGHLLQRAGPEEEEAQQQLQQQRRTHWARNQGGDQEQDGWEPTALCGQRAEPGPDAAAPPTALCLGAGEVGEEEGRKEAEAEEEEEEEGEMVEVVEDDKEEEAKEDEERDAAVAELDASGAPSCPASSSSHSCSPPPEGACSSSSTSAYMWSLELLIAAALCATRDAVQGAPRVAKATVAPGAPGGPLSSAHPGMEILGELADLEIQQRRRQTEGKETEGELMRRVEAGFSSVPRRRRRPAPPPPRPARRAETREGLMTCD